MTPTDHRDASVDRVDWLADRFGENRPRLQAVATRMLGSRVDADDAVQESWLRMSRAGADDVENVGGWMTTIVSRVCLDMLRTRRRSPVFTADASVHDHPDPLAPDPEREAALADAVGPALLIVLDQLEPAERLAFVLHDLFDVPFGEIALILERSPAAVRQLASRARRRVRGHDAPRAGMIRQQQVVGAFLAAARNGDFEALLDLLDPDVLVRSDAAAIRLGSQPEVRGAEAAAATFAGRARAARPAWIDGVPGLCWFVEGAPRVAFRFTVTDERITAIDLIADTAAVSIEVGDPG